MCVDLVVRPALPDAQAGYVIMEAMGYPHFSGSNSICVVTALLECGHIPMGDAGVQVVRLEAPTGLVRARARHDGRHVTSVTVGCDPAWVARRDITVDLPDYGPVRFDLVWSGCFYAVIDAADHGFALTAAERPSLTELAHELCLVATPHLDLVHPTFGDTGDLSFVCFAGPVTTGGEEGGRSARGATYVHPGVLCACPTGTGTAARLALLAADGVVAPGEDLVTVSPTGSTMIGRVVAAPDWPGAPVEVTVTGQAFTLGHQRLVVNADDPLVDAAAVWPLLDGAASGRR
jgi:proline racemase